MGLSVRETEPQFSCDQAKCDQTSLSWLVFLPLCFFYTDWDKDQNLFHISLGFFTETIMLNLAFVFYSGASLVQNYFIMHFNVSLCFFRLK